MFEPKGTRGPTVSFGGFRATAKNIKHIFFVSNANLKLDMMISSKHQQLQIRLSI